jgi:hypothetical protein
VENQLHVLFLPGRQDLLQFGLQLKVHRALQGVQLLDPQPQSRGLRPRLLRGFFPAKAQLDQRLAEVTPRGRPPQDRTGQVVAFKRYTFEGDLILVVVNVSDSQWTGQTYGVTMGGESGTWQEIFNSQAPVYGGINTTGNFG